MAPFLLALALLAQDAAAPAPADGPVATVPDRKQTVEPLPIQGGRVTPPTDDYGFVSWCYGAVSGYVDLYDRAMPEVTRIERAWPTPDTEDALKNGYPNQRKKAIEDVALFKRAIEAAEKASPTLIAPQGMAAMKQGRGVWTGATTLPKSQLAQFWMSWEPPAKCTTTAQALEAKSNLFGQALTTNQTVVASKPAVTTPAEPATALAATSEPAPAEVAKVDTEAAAPEGTVTADAAQEAEPAEMAKVEDMSADDGAAGESIAADVPDVATEEPAPAAEESAASAIDDLLPAADAPAAEEVSPEPEPAPEPAPKSTKKPGLRDTLKGLRGQEN